MIQHSALTRGVSTRGLILSACIALLPFTSQAMNIAADYHVPFTPENAILGHFSPTKAPVLKVKSGSIVAIDGGGGVRANPRDPSAKPLPEGTPPPPPTAEDVNAWLKEHNLTCTVENTPALAETLKVLKETKRPPQVAGGHLLVGPIYVEDAEPGDSLEIRILDVTPRIPFGTVGGRKGSGALPNETPTPFNFVVPLDLKRNSGIFDKDVEVPLAPFMGVMATCPASSEGEFRKSGPPGNFGGNLDCKELCAGSTLYLPVFQKGALFYTGDSHAAQGDGEVTVNAIETANTCTLQFILHKGKTLKMPRAENFDHYITFGLDPDLDNAMHQAILETLDFLKEKQGYDFFHAYALASIGVNFRVTQAVDQTLGIHAMIPKKLFIHDANPYWYREK
jgi:acetamidase/formamidase